MDALTLHRLHFAFTITFHYLFPQLTMGLALLIVVLKTMALRTGNEHYNHAARFWARIFAVNFVMGVVTGIPMEFQFGTNWSRFSRAAGGVIGQTLAMEGVFSFFLESSFPRASSSSARSGSAPRRTGSPRSWSSSAPGSPASSSSPPTPGCSIPTATASAPDGESSSPASAALFTNPWAFWQYLHNMIGAVVTACFRHGRGRRVLLLSARITSLRPHLRTRGRHCRSDCPAFLMAFPTGDGQGKNIAVHQPVTLAAMEGLFHTENGAPLAILGQPDVEKHRLDNPLVVPNVLSFLTYQRWNAEVRGLDSFPQDRWPDNIPLLYYSYHIMVGLGTIFIGVMALAAFALWRGTLYRHAVAALAAHADAAFPLHRHHRRLDDRRTRPPAMADLRPDAHRRTAFHRTSPPATGCSP